MENAVEALKIAGAVLIFVLALSVTISSFNTISQAINNVFNSMDREQYVTDADGNYLNYVKFGKGTREVGADTIVPMIYRAYKENFAIYFYKSNHEPCGIYKNDEGEMINYIDLEKETHGNAVQAEQFIKNLFIWDNSAQSERQYGKFLDYLYYNTFIEMLGEYYMDDVAGNTNTAEVNKIKKRVIAYIQK